MTTPPTVYFGCLESRFVAYNMFLEYDVFLLVTQAYSDKVKKIRVLPTGVEPMTFRLVLRMLYH